MRSKIAAVKETLVKVGAGILQGGHLRLVDDEDEQRKNKLDEVVHRKVSALRTKEKKFETIICQVDRSTGELIIPKRDRGMIRALQRSAEHRTMGWIVAAAIAAFGLIAAYHEVTPAQAIAVERVDLSRSHSTTSARHPWNGARRNDGRDDQISTSGIAPVVETAASDSAVVVAVAEGPKMENVRIRTEFHSTRRADGALSVWSENIYESRPVGSTPPAWTAAAPAAEEKVEIVNINTASLEDIDRILPGVGPVMAKSIVKNRPYRTIQDLRKVRGIGARKFADLAPLVKLN